MQKSRFEEMDVWQDSMNFCETIYDLSEKERFSDDYDLKKQIRRSAISIPSNIAEGFERDSDTEFARFLRIAKGSAGELRTQVALAHRIGYLSETTTKKLLEKIENISKQIYGLIQYLGEREQ